MSGDKANRCGHWTEDLGEILLTEEQIQQRVAELAERLQRDYRGRRPLLVGVLTGAVVFLSDLMRRMQMPVCIDFVQVESYGDATVSSGRVKITKDVERPVEGEDVIVVEDIVDTGRTLAFLVEHLRARGARTVRVCALLNKPSRREVQVQVDYVGFDIPDEFVVGYGLDWAQRYRNLPFVAAVRREAYDREQT